MNRRRGNARTNNSQQIVPEENDSSTSNYNPIARINAEINSEEHRRLLMKVDNARNFTNGKNFSSTNRRW